MVKREGWRKGQPKPAQEYKDYKTKVILSKQHATCIKTQNVCLFKQCVYMLYRTMKPSSYISCLQSTDF